MSPQAGVNGKHKTGEPERQATIRTESWVRRKQEQVRRSGHNNGAGIQVLRHVCPRPAQAW